MEEEEMSKKKMMAKEVRSAAVIVAAEAMDIGCTTLNKVAFNQGVNNLVFVVYTHALGVLFVLPLSFLFHRKVPPPRLTASVVFRLCLLATVSYLFSLSVFIGAGRSSPTLASAIINLSPAFTFILAIIFRMEAVNPRMKSSWLKLIGTLVSMAGAFVVIFYQGPPIYSTTTTTATATTITLPTTTAAAAIYSPSSSDWIVGGFILLSSSLYQSLILIIKAWVLRDFPSEVLVTLIGSSFQTAVAALVAVVAAPDFTAWKLTQPPEFIAVSFTAIFTLGMLSLVHSWACRTKGPVYVAVFKPLQMVIAVFLGVFFLGDTLHLGSVLGGTVIALGFYTVINGKAKEAEEEIKDKQDQDEQSIIPFSSQQPSIDQDQLEAPLLEKGEKDLRFHRDLNSGYWIQSPMS